ncbi:acyl-CoA thioesterase [Ferroplasma acidiphilum]|jgi:Acyl-CoA hydrolase|uniref:acyl-CoA thioesterase n=1 Tax=Ferroplasma acidiphilum TaxID=74969 RepID=UPI0023F40ED6|nr:acyl-CoA thioesterase [Ferroplasma acidiphilum]MCL4349383.1 acyl-CoA thioesterase [Candidatus Thermoplasmatota archaeon]
MGKRVSESDATSEIIVLPGDTNMFGDLYGGRLVEWMDNIGSITAFKHSRKKVVTGSIDNLFFLSPIKLGYIVHLHSFVTYTTKSTMEIEIDVSSENVTTSKSNVTTRAFFTYVALDENGHATEIPEIIPENDIERKRFVDGEKRLELRLQALKSVKADLK